MASLLLDGLTLASINTSANLLSMSRLLASSMLYWLAVLPFEQKPTAFQADHIPSSQVEDLTYAHYCSGPCRRAPRWWDSSSDLV